MAGDNTLLKVGLFGGALFVAYKQGWLSFLGLGTSTPATVSTQPQPSQPTGTPASTGTPAPPTASPFQTANVNSLDAVFQALNKAAPGASMNADDWNWYLMRVVPGFTAPDPAPLFSAAAFDPPWTRDMQMPLGAYWIVMSQYLKSKQGLSGMGMYGTALTGLANIARQYRRASEMAEVTAARIGFGRYRLGLGNCPGDPGCPGYVDPNVNAAIQAAMATQPAATSNDGGFVCADGSPVPASGVCPSMSFSQWLNANAGTVAIGSGILFLVALAVKR